MSEITTDKSPNGWDWYDPSIYEWKISKPKELKTAQQVVLAIVLSTFLFALPFCLLWLVSLLSLQVALFIGVILWFIGLIGVYLGFLYRWFGKRGRMVRTQLAIPRAAMEVISVTLFLFAFNPDPTTGFSGCEHATLGSWTLFLIDNGLGVVLFDIPEVFEWNLSGIKPTTWQACMTVVLLRLLFAVGLIDLFIRVFNSQFRDERFFGTIQECLARCDSVIDTTGMHVCRERRFQRIPETRMSVDEFVKRFKEFYKHPEFQVENESCEEVATIRNVEFLPANDENDARLEFDARTAGNREARFIFSGDDALLIASKVNSFDKLEGKKCVVSVNENFVSFVNWVDAELNTFKSQPLTTVCEGTIRSRYQAPELHDSSEP